MFNISLKRNLILILIAAGFIVQFGCSVEIDHKLPATAKEIEEHRTDRGWYVRARITESEFNAYVESMNLIPITKGKYERAYWPKLESQPEWLSDQRISVADTYISKWTDNGHLFYLVKYKDGFIYLLSGNYSGF